MPQITFFFHEMGRRGSVRRENLSEIIAGVTGSRLYGLGTPNPGFSRQNPGFWRQNPDFDAQIYFPIYFPIDPHGDSP